MTMVVEGGGPRTWGYECGRCGLRTQQYEDKNVADAHAKRAGILMVRKPADIGADWLCRECRAEAGL